MSKRRKVFLEEEMQTKTGENDVEKTEKFRGGRRKNKTDIGESR